MSDIQPVSVDLWRNTDEQNRIPYGSIPMGDYEMEGAGERHSAESFREGATIAQFWGDASEPTVEPVKKTTTRKRGRPRKTDNA